MFLIRLPGRTAPRHLELEVHHCAPMETVNWLFAVFGSVPPPSAALPVVVYELAGSAFDGVACTVTVAAPPPAMLPRLQLTVLPEMLQVPAVVDTEFCVKVAPDGAVVVAVKDTQLAVMLPVPFLICQVNVTGLP